MPHIQPELLKRKNEVTKTNNKLGPVHTTKAILHKPKVGGIQKAKNIQVSKKATAAKAALSKVESPVKKVFTFPATFLLKIIYFVGKPKNIDCG